MRAAFTALAAAAVATAADPNATAEDWLHYGGQPSAWRYSALDQINTSNVRRLTPVWVFQTGDTTGGLQATPIVAGGVMYVSTSRNRVFAIDAATGREIWQYAYPPIEKFGLLYGPWNRGLAIDAERVFLGTLDNSLVALDRKSGREVWRVNVEDMQQCGCNITAAPLVVKDKVITGVTGGDSAHRGYINAFDARTGRHVWRFWTIPGPGEPGNETWSGDSWRYGGGSSWMTGSYDPALNLLYWSVGNPAADFYGESRKGRNLYTDSVVALDPDTGKLKWFFQQIPHDVWDFDTAYENTLVDVPVNGAMRKLLINVNKGGMTFVNDRVTGQFVSAWPVAKNLNWIQGVDPKGELLGRNEPEVGKTKVICPGIAGGRSWNQSAYSPRTGWYYTTGTEWCQEVTAQKEEPREGKEYFGGVFKMIHPPKEKAHGHLGAYDPVNGKQHWVYKSKYPILASVLATAGDVIFTGDPDGYFLAFHARTGEKLWNFQTGSGHRGSSISYSVNGRQYVATPSGWGSALAGILAQVYPETETMRPGSAIFAFALPEDGR